MNKVIVLKKEEVVEDVANRERKKIANFLEEEKHVAEEC